MIDLDELQKLAEVAQEDWDGPVWEKFWDQLSEEDILTLIERVREAEARIAEAAKLHKPVPTGREMYVTGNAGEIYGVEPTYICPSGCNNSVCFFKGDECESWKVLGLNEHGKVEE